MHEDTKAQIGALAAGLAAAAAIFAICAFFDIPLFNEGAEAAVTAAIVDDRVRGAPGAPLPCDLTIAQFGPGERWFKHRHVYECVTASREPPAHLLSSPLSR